MQTMETTSYPTRYVAFDNPCVMVLQTGRDNGEMAIYSEPMQNVSLPHITDGIYIEVYTTHDGRFYMSGHYTEPNKARRQHGAGSKHATLDDALVAAEKFLDSIHGYILSVSWAQPAKISA